MSELSSDDARPATLSGSSPPRWLTVTETALIVAGVAVYLAMPHEINSDGLLRLELTRALARGQIIESPFSLLFAALTLPLYHFGDVVAAFNTAVFLGGLAVVALVLRGRLPTPFIRRLILLLLAASMFGHHAQLFFGEVLTAMFVAVGFTMMVVGSAGPGIALAGLGVVNTPAALPALFVVLLDRARPPRRWLKAAWPIALCAAAVMLDVYLRLGSPVMSGYEGDHGARSLLPYSGLPGFSYPMLFGLMSLLFSFGKGLALFAPGLWLAFKRPVTEIPDLLRRLQRHSIWFVVGLVLVYAKWWAWAGGWFWGPRFLLFASVPAAIALAIHLCDERATTPAKVLTLSVLGWSTWVGINGAVYGQLEMSMCNTTPDLEVYCWYTPEFSALFRPFLVPKTLNASEVMLMSYSLAAGGALAAPFAIDLIGAAARSIRRQMPAPS